MVLFSLKQDKTIEIVVSPMVEASNILGGENAPVLVRYGVRDGDPLSKVTMPDFAFQPSPNLEKIINHQFTPTNNPTGSNVKWALTEYDLYSFIPRKLLSDLAVDDTSAQGLSNAGKAIFNRIVELYKPLLDTDTKRMAFYSDPAFDPATTHANKHGFPTGTVTLMKENTGFISQIKAAIAANKVGNTTITQNAAMTGEGAFNLLTSMFNSVMFTVRQKANSTLLLPTEKPVFIVSDNIYSAYKAYLSGQKTLRDFTFHGYTKDGAAIDTNIEIALLFNGCLVVNASDVFDNHALHLHSQDLGTTASKNAVKYTHTAIFTERDNLQLGFNYQKGSNGLVVEQGSLKNKFGVSVGLFPRMDYQIAELSDKAMSVAGLA